MEAILNQRKTLNLMKTSLIANGQSGSKIEGSVPDISGLLEVKLFFVSGSVRINAGDRDSAKVDTERES